MKNIKEYFKTISQSLNIIVSEDIINQLNNKQYLKIYDQCQIEITDIEEAINIYTSYLIDVLEIDDLFPLWTDNNSNYIGVYIKGHLEGKVCFFSHEADISPTYPNITVFLNELMKDVECNWEDLQTYYPILEKNICSEQEKNENLKIIEELNKVLKDENLSEFLIQHYSFSIMALTPHTHLETIYPFLQSEDMYIQEKACNILGLHQYKPAITFLKEITENGTINGKFAAQNAINNMYKK